MNNSKVKILWSGITGRTGTSALKSSQTCEYANIVAGICRNNTNFYNYDELDNIKEDFDVIVDFSHKDSLDKVLRFALKVKKPLIVGTAKLSEEQIKSIEEAAKVIPIFRGGNFQFKIKRFIDDVVEYAKTCSGDVKLIETYYKNKTLPSETSKVIANRVLNEAGKKLKIETFLEYDEIIIDLRVAHIHCQTYGFEQLGKDVLKIASMMISKDANGVYDLDRLVKESECNTINL